MDTVIFFRNGWYHSPCSTEITICSQELRPSEYVLLLVLLFPSIHPSIRKVLTTIFPSSLPFPLSVTLPTLIRIVCALIGIGSSFLTLSHFCIYLAVALFVNYLFQVTFFASWIVIYARWEKTQSTSTTYLKQCICFPVSAFPLENNSNSHNSNYHPPIETIAGLSPQQHPLPAATSLRGRFHYLRDGHIKRMLFKHYVPLLFNPYGKCFLVSIHLYLSLYIYISIYLYLYLIFFYSYLVMDLYRYASILYIWGSSARERFYFYYLLSYPPSSGQLSQDRHSFLSRRI